MTTGHVVFGSPDGTQTDATSNRAVPAHTPSSLPGVNKTAVAGQSAAYSNQGRVAQARGAGVFVPRHPGAVALPPRPAHPAQADPHGNPHGPKPHAGPGAGNAGPGANPGPGAGGLAGGPFAALLKNSGTQQLLDPGLADQIAGPDYAAAASLQSELDQLPGAKANALKNLASWYGQVTGAESNAATKDKAMADAGSASMLDAAKGIMASLGGSAMAGSGQIGAVGANDANTLSAIGAQDKSLAGELAPIFASEKAGALTQETNRFNQGKMDLTNQKATAEGQAQADKANALMAIIGANNNARQGNFQNKAGLLNTLAGLQISGVNAQTKAQEASILNALHISEINKNNSKTVGGLAAMSPAQKQALASSITAGLVDPNSHKLTGDWPTSLRNARNSVREAGLDPFNAQVVNTIIGPALANAGITNQGGGFWSPIYQP